MNKIEEILLEESKDHPFARVVIKNTHLQNAMKQFGKICFEAGRKGKYLDKWGMSPGTTFYQEYNTYEEFLEEIEDENI